MLAEAGLTASQLTAIAYSCGPGSFTGVRIAAAAAQGLAWLGFARIGDLKFTNLSANGVSTCRL